MSDQTPTRRTAPPPRTVEAQVGRIAGGEPEPAPDPLVALSTRVPASLRKRLRIAALRRDVDVQDAIAEGIRLWLDRHETDQD